MPLCEPDLHPAFGFWGKRELGMTSFVQNLLALRGLAPRVYGLARVNGTHAAQVTDYIEETDPLPCMVELIQAFRSLGIRTHKHWDVLPHKGNWRDGLFVDFSGLYIEDDAIEDIVQALRTRATMKKGLLAGSSYQAVDELEIPGDRPSSRRLPHPLLALPSPLSVLDLGCNLGHFLRRIVDQRPGTTRVVGVEKLEETTQLCRMINVLLGYWNVDVVTAKLPAESDAIPAIGWDLVVCLSTVKYLGDLDAVPWLASLAPALWIEGHGGVDASYYLPALERSYQTVERLPDTTDNKRRVQFFCTNEGD